MSDTPSAVSQYVETFASRPETASLINEWNELAANVIREALAIQAIPAPTFEEAPRAQAVLSRLAAAELSDVATDDIHNVYARTPGRDPSRPALLVSAHLDTVFPASTNLSTHDDPEHGHIYGPGLGDNSLGLAGMLTLARQFAQHQVTPAADIWWVATVGEEGLGDLRGIRHACDKLKDRLGLGIIIEGMGIGRVYHAGLGVRRLQVSVSGPGGHSWLHSDRPSAIHHLLQIGAALVEQVHPSQQPKSSFNIGLISGGASINTRAPNASLSIDLRSEDTTTLRYLEQQVNRIVEHTARPPEIRVSVTVIGDRPSASLSPAHPLVQAGVATLAQTGFSAPVLEIGSTDANIPLALGVPTVCIGLTTGGDAHSRGEYIDTAPLTYGMQRAALLTLIAAEHTDDWNGWQ